MSNGDKQKWFLLTSKSREEQRAFDNLTSQGFEVFLPKISKVIKRQGVKSVSLVPLFPNYLFINLNDSEANFNAIRSTRGVGSFVRFGLNHATIQTNLIEKIKGDVKDGESNQSLEQMLNFTSGEKVEISDGPFKGLQAIYQVKNGLERSILLINMLGQQNEVVIENQSFEKLD
ncbi:transcription/translation regulatory transformer protein RfaH [Thalassotalea psychrophila]|uniref:Transcription/translation regulatory transformer protein RfaH n=1 Tax=Thalassotalea psychrophila TaxID=3065647 RepID=A0ABY9TQW1_9GAMM|nr:transcription/translation regulatory transformer protein RfaH [Colwelliaceae bacterium SQ149]